VSSRNHDIAKPDIDLHRDSCLAKPGVKLEPDAGILCIIGHGFDGQIIEFINQSVIKRHTSDLPDKSADRLNISRHETKKIDIPRCPGQGKAHAHQQEATF